MFLCRNDTGTGGRMNSKLPEFNTMLPFIFRYSALAPLLQFVTPHHCVFDIDESMTCPINIVFEVHAKSDGKNVMVNPTRRMNSQREERDDMEQIKKEEECCIAVVAKGSCMH